MSVRSSRKRAGQSHRLWQILIIVLGFLLIFAGKIDLFALRSLQSGISGIFAPMFDMVATPVRAVETMFEGMRTVASLREETLRLRAENEHLKRWQRRAEILESENRQLRTVLGAVVPPDRRAITARAVVAPGSSFSHAILIMHDADKSIRAGDPVVTADGLVGYVIDTRDRYSWVLLISDVNSRIPVLLSSSSWPALAIGQNSGVLELGFLPFEAMPHENELVLTSGHGDVLPAGLPIGRVMRGGGRQFYIQPVVDLRMLSFVSVLVRAEQNPHADINIFDQFFTPLPEKEEGRLLEGFSTKDVLQ